MSWPRSTPRQGRKDVALDLQVDPGRTVTGTIVDPDERPIVGGVEVRTLDVFQGPHQSPMNTATFEVRGLPPGRSRLDFIHRGRKLAGSLALHGDERNGLTVKLMPWGTVVGRIVDEEGKPRTDVEIFSFAARPSRRRALRPREQADGRRPGPLPHRGPRPGREIRRPGTRAATKPNGPILKDVQLEPGEVKDLGDITLPTWKPDGN